MSLIQRLLEESVKWKAGGFPFCIIDGEPHVGLFVSNDPNYGGPRPQMPKGHPDGNEGPQEAAIREVSEETGIPESKLKARVVHVGAYSFKGEVSNYVQEVFAFVLDDFVPVRTNAEGKGVWLRLDDALSDMRKDQVKFLEDAIQKAGLTTAKKSLAPPDWRRPNEAELRLEYQLEYVNKNLQTLVGDRWSTVDEWLEDAKSAKLVDISPSMDDSMRYRSHTGSKEQLIKLLKSYRSWPEFRNMDTVNRLYAGLSDGSTLPAPIVLDIDGKLRIFGGNTRADAFRQLYPGKSYKALLMKV